MFDSCKDRRSRSPVRVMTLRMAQRSAAPPRAPGAAALRRSRDLSQPPRAACTPPETAAVQSRRLALSLALAAVSAPRPAAAAVAALWERVDAKQLDKVLFSAPPALQTYPAWLEGTWDCVTAFAGYEFPSQRISKERLVRDPSVPGFLQLSVMSLADVGAGGTHQLRFTVGADGRVVEDRVFNLRSVADAQLRKRCVQSVEYAPQREPNRLTVRLLPGAVSGTERVELFFNGRESATRPSDGTFYALECTRQVSLGYSTQFNAPRVAVTDYEQVWTYKLSGPDHVLATLVTAGYVQPNEALAYTSQGPGATPQLGQLLSAATEPVVLYSHTVDMRRTSATTANAEPEEAQ